MHVLGDIDVATFLRDYWQKQPLLIRNAIPGYTDPVMPEELAGLALEEDVESRLIQERGGLHPWQLRHGPFNEDDFTRLPPTHWTLLVQEINTQVPDLARLLELFDFIPQWRIDDVMVSFAPEHGSVGPHVDQYDVFLLQGMGRRRWQIHSHPVTDADMIPGLDLRILANFEPEQEWVLQRGDMLYLPPGVAHYGVALSDCMTYSIGFRAPGIADMLTDFTEGEMVNVDPSRHFADPDLKPQRHSGEISSHTLQRIREILGAGQDHTDTVNEWFGLFITAPAAGKALPLPLVPAMSVKEVDKAIQDADYIYRSEFFRFAFIERNPGIRLFICGNEYLLDEPIAELGRLIADRRSLQGTELAPWTSNPEALKLLTELLNHGYLYLDQDDD